MNNRLRSDAGFTMVEMLVTMGLIMVLATGSMTVFSRMVPTMRANSQVNRVLSLLQNGRDAAIAMQRLHIVRFDAAANTVTLIRLDGGVEIPVEMIAFEYGVRIMLDNGAPDTPDGYGNADPVDFPEEGMFDSEGSFVDDVQFLPMNGTLFLGIPSTRAAARAITITGSTGRARFYIWNGNEATWEGGWLAK